MCLQLIKNYQPKIRNMPKENMGGKSFSLSVQKPKRGKSMSPVHLFCARLHLSFLASPVSYSLSQLRLRGNKGSVINKKHQHGHLWPPLEQGLGVDLKCLRWNSSQTIALIDSFRNGQQSAVSLLLFPSMLFTSISAFSDSHIHY